MSGFAQTRNGSIANVPDCLRALASAFNQAWSLSFGDTTARPRSEWHAPVADDDARLATFDDALRIREAIKPHLDDVARISERSKDAKREIRRNLGRYIRSQPHPDVARSLSWLFARDRAWNFVSFRAFHDACTTTFDRLIDRIQRAQGTCCICIDDPFKSSFWMTAMFIEHAASRCSAKTKKVLRNRLRFHVAERYSSGYVNHALGSQPQSGMRLPLPENSTLVFIDDAAYSGMQMTEHISETLQDYAASHRRPPAACLVAIPFMSDTASQLIRSSSSGVEMLVHTTFRGLFHGRNTRDVLQNDIILLPKGSQRSRSPSPRSLFFDFLRLENFHTTTIFEHKIPDAVSIPHMLLHIGMIPSTHDYTFCKIAPQKIDALRRQATALMLKASPGPKDESRAVHDVLNMKSSGAKKVVILPLSAAPAAPAASHSPSMSPILPVSICLREYQDAFHALFDLRDAHRGGRRDIARAYMQLPECYSPPYKNSQLQAAVNESLRSLMVD